MNRTLLVGLCSLLLLVLTASPADSRQSSSGATFGGFVEWLWGQHAAAGREQLDNRQVRAARDRDELTVTFPFSRWRASPPGSITR